MKDDRAPSSIYTTDGHGNRGKNEADWPGNGPPQGPGILPIAVAQLKNFLVVTELGYMNTPEHGMLQLSSFQRQPASSAVSVRSAFYLEACAASVLRPLQRPPPCALYI